MEGRLPTASEVCVKTAVVHTVTYFMAGVAAYTLFNYPALLATTALGASFRSLRTPLVVAAPALQPIRGVLFGAVFYVLKEPFFGAKKGWLTMWVVLVSLGIVGTFGAAPSSIEGVIYTELPLSLHLRMLPELLAQSLALSWLVFQWVNHPDNRWIGWALGGGFVLVLLFATLGSLAAARG